MNSVTTLKRQVEEIKATLLPEEKKHIVIVALYPWNSEEPHGMFGAQKLDLDTQQCSAVPVEQEEKLLREHYETVSEHYRKIHSFNEYLQLQKCKCGEFGHEG